MDECGAPAAAGVESFRYHADDRVEVRARKVSVGPRSLDEREEFIFAVFATRRFGDELLRQYIERSIVVHD
jgi:hypothetical protein